MWILSVLPDWVFHLIFTAGLLGTIAGFVLGMIPAIKQYIIPIRVLSILTLVFGTWLEGGLADNQAWQLKVKELEAKLAEAQAESQKENVKIVEKIVKKTEYIKQRGQTIYVEIDKNREILDKNCKVPKEFIVIHNKAAEAPK